MKPFKPLAVTAPGPRIPPDFQWANPDPAQTPRGIGWTQPDYKALIEAAIAPFRQQLGGFSAADAAALAAAQRRAVVQFGEYVPGNLDLLGPNYTGNIDETTRRLAAENTQAGLSTVARLNRAHTDALRQITNVLAARGVLRSGQTGAEMGREQTNYTTAQYDSRQNLLDYLGGLQAGFAQAEQQRQWQLAQAAIAAQQNIPPQPNRPWFTGPTDPNQLMRPPQDHLALMRRYFPWLYH